MTTEREVKILSATPPGIGEYLRTCWAKRHILSALLTRDFKQQYVQTRLGILWPVLKPLIIVLIFTTLFSYLLNVPTSHYPYALFSLSGFLGWTLFTNILNSGSDVLKRNSVLIQRMSFPLLLLILLGAANALFEWVVTFIMLVVLMFILGVFPTVKILAIVVILPINIMLGLGLVTWLNILSTRYKDMKHLVPYLVGFGIWLTPVFFPVSIVPERYARLIDLNPLTGILGMYRYSLFGDVPSQFSVLWAVGLSVVLCASGIYFFNRREQDIIDHL